MTNTCDSRSAGRAPLRNAAFVVHLIDAADGSGDQARGRVEHVNSGRTARFDSLTEMLRFMRQTLAELDADGC